VVSDPNETYADEATGAHDALPLRTVSRLTGLSADLIRAWEKRYAVVQPKRGPRGARLYTAADVTQLRLLRQVVGAGRAIGDVARLARPELEALAGAPSLAPSSTAAPRVEVGDGVVQRALEALVRFDALTLDRCLSDALIGLGSREFIRQVAAPLLNEVGERWTDGRLSVADEHLLSGLMRNLLTGLMRTRSARATPLVLLATPAGERHEFGLLLAGLLVADAGLGLCYLGTDLPAAEVAGAARRANAAVVGLGLVNGDNQRAAIAEVRRVERELPADTELWLGGRQAAAVAAHVGATRAVVLDQLTAVESAIGRVRAAGAARL
jgi:MerR family transcriptional regulator, light-induced transcriptional regulator